MKNVTLIGASGFVGKAILEELLNRGHQVTAVVRDAKKITSAKTNLTVVETDVENHDRLLETIKGKDAVISAYNPGWANPNIYEDTLRIYPKILQTVKDADVSRLLIVGGAGSLFVKPGVRLMDTGALPAEWIPGVTSLAKFYIETLTHEDYLDWVFLSPAANLGNLTAGTRTGKYRTGKDYLLTDANGDSFISVEDYAVAMVDELENEAHHRERFTVAY